MGHEEKVGRLHHMPVSERAKIFIPFDPLDGFKEALERKEREVEAERAAELSEDAREELDAALDALEEGQLVSVCYFDGLKRTVLEGPVARIDRERGLFVIANTPVPFEFLISLA